MATSITSTLINRLLHFGQKIRASIDKESSSHTVEFTGNSIFDDPEAQHYPSPHGNGNAKESGSRRDEGKRSTAFLDGLRGISALCVFTQHLMGNDEHRHGFGETGHYYFVSLPFIRVFYSGGAAAVSVFFVLSGYVLSQSAVRMIQRQERHKCRNYLISASIKRPIRLYLPCLGVTLLIALLVQLPYKVYPELPWLHPQPSLRSELVHWLLECVRFFNPFRKHAWLGSLPYEVVLWTIPIELKGSVLVYVLSAILCHTRASPVHFAAALLGAMVVLLYVSWWTGACFVGGLVLSIIDRYEIDIAYCDTHFTNKAKTILMNMLFILGYYLLSQPVDDGHPETSAGTPGWGLLTSLIPETYTKDDYYRFWLSYGAMLVTYTVLRLRWLQRILNTKPLQHLGYVSYMLYLVHPSVFLCIGDRVRRLYGRIPAFSEPLWYDNLIYIPDIGPKGLDLRWNIGWVTVLSITLCIAHIGTKWIDEPSVRLGRSLTRMLDFD